MDKSIRRPKDYPVTPRVALIAGHMAGRGITIQNPLIDFTCTSFCFTDTKNLVQRGATNAQRFGRACGMLSDVFSRPGRMPILIATEGILQDAIANEKALFEKASLIENGSFISLKDLISDSEWDSVMKATKIFLNVKKLTNEQNEIARIDVLIMRYYNMFGKKNIVFIYKNCNTDDICNNINKKDHGKNHKTLIQNGYLIKINCDITFTELGKEYAINLIKKYNY